MNMTKPLTNEEIVKRILKELESSNTKFKKRFDLPAEALGVIREEYKEFEDEVFAYKNGQPQSNMCIELIQIAAMSIKAIQSFWGKEEDKPECFNQNHDFNNKCISCGFKKHCF